MTERMFYQVHTCEGYRAKVTIEWDIPPTVEEINIKGRMNAAEVIVDDIMEFAGPKMRDVVRAMRGIS